MGRSGSRIRRTGSSIRGRATRRPPSSASATSSGSTARPAELAIVSDALIDPNGLAFSPDEQTLYVSDTSAARIDDGNHHMLAFDVVDGRQLARPRVFKVIEPGFSDGFRVDVEGNIWTSAGDGIHVLAPDATELGRIVLPEAAANCQFGGPAGRTLFVTATSTLWSIEVGIRGAITPWVDGAGTSNA